MRKSWQAWVSRTQQKQMQDYKLSRALLMIGGMKLERSFYWWATLARYLAHMRGAMQAIQDRVSTLSWLGCALPYPICAWVCMVWGTTERRG